MAYDVFISFKNTAPGGGLTKDRMIAERLHGKLLEEGLEVFFSEKDLSETAFIDSIYSALDEAKLLILVGTSKANVTSKWVKSEWTTFFGAMHSGRKSDGQIMTVLDGMSTLDLPIQLEPFESFNAKELDKAVNFAFKVLDKVKKSEAAKAEADEQERLRREAEAKAEKERLEREAAEAKAEQERLEREAAEKAAAEERKRLEEERIKAEQARKAQEEAQRKAEEERIKREQAEAEAARALEHERNRAEYERKREEEQKRREREMAEKLEQARILKLKKRRRAILIASVCIAVVFGAIMFLRPHLAYRSDSDGYYVSAAGIHTFAEQFTIPKSHFFKPVLGIDDGGFEDCDSLTSVTIPDSVTSIGNDAFCYCRSLTSVSIPDSVTSIGESAFFLCNNLTSVSIPDSVTSIGDRAFAGCRSLTSVSIPDSVTSIGDRAFIDCSSLTSVTIPDSVTSIGNEAFSSCPSLDISVDPRNSNYCAVSNVIYDKSKTELLCCSAKVSGEFIIPDSVTSIGENAFYDCNNLTWVSIPDSVTSIGYEAFYSCDSLTSVTIPDSVTSIGDWAFSYCDNLASVTIPDSVTIIGDMAFYSCDSLASVTIPDSVTSIGNTAFSRCPSLDISVDPRNSNYCAVSNVIYDKSKTELLCCSAKVSGEFIIPDSVTSIGDSAFYYCNNLTSVTIPDSVTSIGYHAFQTYGDITIFAPHSADYYGYTPTDKEHWQVQ